jgi:hypothetical protein
MRGLSGLFRAARRKRQVLCSVSVGFLACLAVRCELDVESQKKEKILYICHVVGRNIYDFKFKP